MDGAGRGKVPVENRAPTADMGSDAPGLGASGDGHDILISIDIFILILSDILMQRRTGNSHLDETTPFKYTT